MYLNAKWKFIHLFPCSDQITIVTIRRKKMNLMQVLSSLIPYCGVKKKYCGEK